MREITSYEYMHTKVKLARGRAAEHGCVDCGKTARDWSMKHDAQEIRYQVGGTDEGKAFSLDVESYEPRCRRCHSAYDLKHDLMRAPVGNHSTNPRGWHVRGYMH